MANETIYIVDIGSFSIDEETKNKINTMDFEQQRKWLARKVLDGSCDIVNITQDQY